MQVKYYMVKTVDGLVVKITEKKAPNRDSLGHFVGKRPAGGYCRWYGCCPFTTKGA